MQRSVNLILEIGKMKTKSAQNTNEFNCVDSMVSLIWTPVKRGQSGHTRKNTSFTKEMTLTRPSLEPQMNTD
jgi:hypothetical protein